jgi:hypothetical protein
VEALVPVVCNPMYNAVYAETLKSFPGAAFLITVTVMTVCIVAFT